MLLTRVKLVSTKGSHTFVSWQFYLQKTINVLSEYDKNAVTVGGSTWKSYYVSDRDWRVLDLLRHPSFIILRNSERIFNTQRYYSNTLWLSEEIFF